MQIKIFRKLFIENYNTVVNELRSSTLASKTKSSKTGAKATPEIPAGKKIASSAIGMRQNKTFFDDLATVIGTDGEFLHASEARQKLMAGEIKDGKVPVFVNDDSATARLYISMDYRDEIKDKLDNSNRYDVELYGNDLKVTSKKTGDYTIIHCGKNKIGVKTGKGNSGKAAISKYLIPRTAAQESMIAGILQLLADIKSHKTRLEQMEIPESVVAFLGEKKTAKLNDFAKWLLASNPIEKTGICAYVDFEVPDDDIENFQVELADFLFNGSDNWYKSFNALYNSNILDEISNVFTDAIQDWKSALFLHFWRFQDGINDGKSLRNTVVDDYLNKARCGSQKDTIDKADIFLVFDFNEAKKIIEDLMEKTKDRNDYFSKMTNYINAKKFIGISLKKISGEVTLAAVNFKTETNAVGDNINPEKKVCLKYAGENDLKNTFAISENSKDPVKKNFAKVKVPKMEGKVTYVIEIPFHRGHWHDLHVSEHTKLQISIRSNSSRLGAVTVEAKFTNAAANLGKMVTGLKKKLQYDPVAELNAKLQKLKQKNKNALPKQYISAAYEKVARDILERFTKNELGFYEILANGIGYPIEKINKKGKREYIVDSAPYIKIY